MISHVHNKKEWMLSYRFMNMSMKGIKYGTQAESKEDVFANYVMSPDRMNMQMHMVMGMYGITNRLTVMAMFNYQLNAMDMSMYSAGHMHGSTTMSSSVHTMKTKGLGDTKLHALYAFLQRSNFQLLGTLGVTIPTGNIQLKGATSDPMFPDTRYPYGMQLGSGTFDVLPGVGYLFQKNQFASGTTISATCRTGYNKVGYRLGDELLLSTWLAYKWLSVISSSLRLEAMTTGAVQGYDPTLYYFTEPSANPANYGGNRLNAFFGSSFHFKGWLTNNRLSIEAGIPFYQDLNGIQLKQKLVLNAAWSVTF